MARCHIKNTKSIELSLPIDPAYVSVARLTAYSVSERMEFSSEAIDDIKSAVSEACTYIIKRCTLGGAESFTLRFLIEEPDVLLIHLQTTLPDTILTPTDADTLGMCVMQKLMDHMEIFFEDGCLGIQLAKKRYRKHRMDELSGGEPWKLQR